MGTNYDWHRNPCEKCGHGEILHIGKSSAGWCFSLHIIPEEGINDLSDWEKVWDSEEGKIFDEYNNEILIIEMLDIIKNRSSPKQEFNTQRTEGWYMENSACPGPNGLVRHRIGRYCVKHGEGTWDCIPGEFS